MNKKQMMRIARLTLVVAGALTMTGYAEARNEDICSHFIRNYKRSNFYEQIQNSPFQNSSIGKIASPVPGDLDAATGSTSLRLKVKPGKVPNGLAARAHSAVALDERSRPSGTTRTDLPVRA